MVLVRRARFWSGIATANIAVAQAYIADVTPPRAGARGMGIIGMGFGLGFIIGPFAGGALGHVLIHGRRGALPAFVAAGLSVVNLIFALVVLPESLPRTEARGKSTRRLSPLDFKQLRAALELPGVGQAIAINFNMVFWFAGMEQTRSGCSPRTASACPESGRPGRNPSGLVGIVAATVQGGLISRLSRRVRRRAALASRAECSFQALRVQGLAWASARTWGHFALVGLYAGTSAGLIAFGNGLCTPTPPAFVSRRAGRRHPQG